MADETTTPATETQTTAVQPAETTTAAAELAQAGSSEPASAGSAETVEPGQEPAAAPQDANSEPASQAEAEARGLEGYSGGVQGGSQDDGKTVQTMNLAFSPEQIAALTADLKGHLDDGFTAIKKEFAQKMDELAEHCEKRIDALAEVAETADMAGIKMLVDDAKQAIEAIRNSGAAGLADRLAKLEMQLRHSL